MYNQKIMNRFNNPYNAGNLRGANATGKAGAVENGEYIKIYFKIDEDNVIIDAKFKAYGSAVTIAVCDYMCDLLCNREIEDAMTITGNDLLNALDIPNTKLATVSLVVDATRFAIETYLKKLEKRDQNS